MAVKLSDWLDERIGWRNIWETVFKRKIPHVNWLYTLGSATLLAVVNQAVTGILLTIYYPGPEFGKESEILGEVTHHFPNFFAVSTDIFSIHQYLTGGGFHQGDQNPHKCRFPGTVRTQ